MFGAASWLALLALFFASGASGLIYEIVWMRLLSLTMSVTVYAVTTVLCAFMAGLALGAAIAGRVAHRVRRPLLAYGCVEIVLAAVALITPTLLFHLGPIYASIHAAFGGGGFGFAIARFVLAFGVLLIPSTLMGTTLPLLSRAVIQNTEVVGRGAGALYAVNTLGAVVGCVAAGFVLIPNLGLSLTNGFAASVSLAVGIVASLLGRNLVTSTDHVAARSMPASRDVRLAYVAIAISGFTALGYQVLWTRALEQYTHNSTYAYSAILATFLLGIASGSAVAAPLVDRLRRPLLGLGVIELVISGSVLAALLLYANLDQLSPQVAQAIGGLGSWGQVVALIFTQASAVLLFTTFLFGMTFPFVARIVVDRLDSVGERIATAYTANTAGSIFGSVVIGFAVLPVLGMQGTFLALATLNALVGLALAWRAVEGRGRVVALGAVAVLAVLAATVLPSRLFEQTFVRRFGELAFYREEVTDTIMVTDDAKRGRMIRYGDGRGTAGTGTVKEDRMYAQIPMLLHANPLRVLNICFGVGNSLSSVAMHPVERIDSVELSPGVVDARRVLRDHQSQGARRSAHPDDDRRRAQLPAAVAREVRHHPPRPARAAHRGRRQPVHQGVLRAGARPPGAGRHLQHLGQHRDDAGGRPAPPGAHAEQRLPVRQHLARPAALLVGDQRQHDAARPRPGAPGRALRRPQGARRHGVDRRRRPVRVPVALRVRRRRREGVGGRWPAGHRRPHAARLHGAALARLVVRLRQRQHRQLDGGRDGAEPRRQDVLQEDPADDRPQEAGAAAPRRGEHQQRASRSASTSRATSSPKRAPRTRTTSWCAPTSAGIGDLVRPRSFDAVVCLDVVEHLERAQALELLATLESIARRRVVVFTPNGFVPQPATPDNPYQEHLSGFTTDEMRDLGYTVRGIHGLWFLLGAFGETRLAPGALWRRVVGPDRPARLSRCPGLPSPSFA